MQMGQKMIHSLQFKIFIYTLLIVFIPLVLLGYVYYFVSNELAMERLQKQDENMVSQISENISFILKDTNDLSLFFLQSEQAQKLLNHPGPVENQVFEERKRSVGQLLSHLIGSKAYFSSIQIEDNHRPLVNTHRLEAPLSELMTTQLDALNGKGLLRADPVTGSIAYSRLVKNVNDVTESLGYITIQLDAMYIKQLFQNKNTNNTDNYFLINEHENVIVSEETLEFSEDELDLILHQNMDNNSSETISIHKTKYIKTYIPVKNAPLSIVHIVSLDELMMRSQVIPSLIIVALIVSLFLCTLAAYQFSKYIVQPIKNLQLLMKDVENGNFAVRFKTKGHNEIDQLGMEFNAMLQRTDFLVKLVYLVEIKKKEAEIKALYSQINPHFLYNTLDSIYWMGQMEKAPKTAKMIHALSRLFRIMLKDQKEITTVATEIDYVKHYIEIQKLRYEEMITIDIAVDEEAYVANTIKLVLQPLIENAITHGIEPKENGGTVYIKVYKREKTLEITVEDDGVGADIGALTASIDTTFPTNDSIALKNIHDRITIRDGEDFGLTFSESDKGGLKVTVRQSWEV